MSIVYSDTSGLTGILQRIERELGFSYGYITGNTERLKEWTSEVNLEHDYTLAAIFKAGGTWQFDDINHGDYPIIKANLVSSQRDYAFTTDESGNIVLDIYRVMIKTPNGVYVDVTPMDQQEPQSDTSGFVDGQNLTGTPTKYDKTANGIFLDPIPSYNSTEGIKVFINREGSYFLTTDTTKKPGVDGRLHEIYVVGPCARYAGRKGLANFADLERRRVRLAGDETNNIRGLLQDIYGRRQRDVKGRLSAQVEETR